MIDFRRYLKQKSPSYFGFREIEPEELRVIFSKNSGYAELVGGIECFLRDDMKRFFVLKGYKMVKRVCTRIEEVLEVDSLVAKKLYFLNSADILEFINKVRQVYGDIHFYNYKEITTRKPLTLLVKEDAKF